MRTLEQPNGDLGWDPRVTSRRPLSLGWLVAVLLIWSGAVVPAATIDPSGAPNYHLLLINELQSLSSGGVVGQNFSTDPWVELFNPSPKPVSLEGFALSDSYYAFRKWRFPAGASIPAGGYLVIWMDGQAAQTTAADLHANFKLNPRGGSLALTMLVQGHPMVVDYLDYPAIPMDASYGVVPSAASLQRRLLIHPTPWAANIFLPTVVINEWFVSPPDGAGWFEFYNPSTESVSLTGLVISMFDATGQQSSPFVIPKGRKLDPHGFMRVWADNRPDLNLFDSKSLHVPFVLPTFTFTLQLATTSGLLINQVVTKVSNPKLPEARYPDGSRLIDEVNLDTPAAPNVGSPRFVQRPPEGQRLRVGASLVLNSLAEGSAPISYQWYRNEQRIAGATDPTLKFSSLTAADAGSYMVRASNPAGSSSAFSLLTVLERPQINIDSAPIVSVALGKSFRLPAAIAGTGPFQVQWKRNGMNIPQAEQPTFFKDVVAIEDGGSYTAALMNEAGAVLSIPIRIIVDVPNAKVADDFADRLSLGETAQGSLRGSNLGASKEVGEPLHADNRGGRSVWFSWTPSKSGIATLDTRGSTFDTLLAVYTGNAVNALKRVESDDDRGGYFTSSLRFNASAKTTYAIAVDGYGGDTNDFVLNWSLDSTTLQLPVILKHPDSLTAVPGSTVSFRVAASANTAAYQWLFKGRPIRGATQNTLTLSKVDLGDIGPYSVQVTSTDKQVIESYPARLELGDLPRPPTQDKYDPPSRMFSSPSAFGRGSLQLADTTGFIPLGAGTIGSQKFTSEGSNEAGELHCGSIGGSSRFASLLLTSQTEVIVDTIGSNHETILAVYEIGKDSSYKFIDCDKNGSSSTVRFTGTAGTAYYAFVDSNDKSPGTNFINWRCGSVPKLVSPNPPVAKSIDSGEAFHIDTKIEAVPSLISFQWLVDGAASAAGSATLLSVPAAGPDDSGTYSLVLSNAMGSITGMVGTVAVQVPFELSAQLENAGGTKDVLLKGMSEQGFIVEASQDLVSWCYFGVNAVPLTPYSYKVTNPEAYPRLFFRCQPWPVTPPYEPVLCIPGYP